LKRAASSLATILTLLFPFAAAACPQCAGRSDGNVMRTIVLGAFVFFPFAVVAVVIRVVRAGELPKRR
jgi:hypothetical protein